MEIESEIIVQRQVLTPDLLSLLADYALLKARVSPNRYSSGDALKRVHRAYGDPLMEVLLQRFTPLVEAAVGRPLWPTLSFYYTYEHGQKLLRHRDRSSCQIVAGLCIGADEAFKAESGTWPLWFNFNGKSVPHEVGYGDLVIFRGHTLEHWREPFSGEWFISAIFGFVEQDGPFSYQKYDQRLALGHPHVGMFRWTWGCLKHGLKSFFIRHQ